MSKKKFGSVADTLSSLADELPVQRPPKEIVAEAKEEGAHTPKRKPLSEKKKIEELVVQYPLKMRASLRDKLSQMAALEGMTMRGFIMSALKEKGLEVTKEDMVDRRKK